VTRSRSALVLLIGVLGVYVVVRRVAIPDDADFGANLAMTVVVAGLAAAAGLSAADVGLSRDTAAAGLRLGAVCVAVIAAVLLLAFAVPLTRGLFDDERADVGALEMAYVAAIRIPLGTVLFEELVFRGVLLALLRREMATAAAVVWSAVLFGLWHVPSLVGDGGAGQLVGTVVVTTLAGLGFGWLRVRSDSLLAPILAHVGTNSIAFVLAWAE
jgi:membrane protease YdiL (CAAX protease family)